MLGRPKYTQKIYYYQKKENESFEAETATEYLKRYILPSVKFGSNYVLRSTNRNKEDLSQQWKESAIRG
jgi:hypothetical protein